MQRKTKSNAKRLQRKAAGCNLTTGHRRTGCGRLDVRMVLAAGLAGLLPGLAAFAQDVDCGDMITQIEMTACSEQAWQVADADLNDGL